MALDLRFNCDDGSKQDLRVASLLEKYNFRGTFYIAPFYSSNQFQNLSVYEIKELSKKHEIGGHTLTHALLTELEKSKAMKELTSGKDELEEYTGKPIKKFAPPKGYYNKKVNEWIKQSGFTESRTMKQGCTDITGYDKFCLPITVHFHPLYLQNWKKLFFEALKKENGYFCVTAHGWEIDKFNLWKEYEEMLKIIYENTIASKNQNKHRWWTKLLPKLGESRK